MSSFLKVPNTVSRRHSTPDEITTGLATIAEVKAYFSKFLSLFN